MHALRDLFPGIVMELVPRALVLETWTPKIRRRREGPRFKCSSHAHMEKSALS